MGEWVDVEAVDRFPRGERRVVEVDGVFVAVFNVDGEFLAIEDACSHDRDSLGDGPLLGTEVTCPRHGARFCLRTGRALSPPAYEPVCTFPVRICNERVQVRDPRWD